MDQSSFFSQPFNADKENNGIYQLFASADLKLWILGLIKFWNRYTIQELKTVNMVSEWSIRQQQYGLNFFCASECVQFINAIFFYKLHPEQLFDGVFHLEKLISLRTKLELLHNNIELIQQQLYQLSARNGLERPVDYLLHHDELPPGIKLEINEHYKSLIQEAVKEFKIQPSPTILNKLNTRTLVHNLLAAYKFWFNPNRLIDTVMLLKQSQTNFEQSLVNLYQQLTTTECLDLYGYFANMDTKYLLHAFYITINAPQSLKWLPNISAKEKQAATQVFSTLMSVIESVRVELNNRAISTASYRYEIEKDSIEIGKRNRNALLRALRIYSTPDVCINPSLEQLFRDVEYLQNQPVDVEPV